MSSFAATVYAIWKARNDLVFEHILPDVDQVILVQFREGRFEHKAGAVNIEKDGKFSSGGGVLRKV